MFWSKHLIDIKLLNIPGTLCVILLSFCWILWDFFSGILWGDDQWVSSILRWLNVLWFLERNTALLNLKDTPPRTRTLASGNPYPGTSAGVHGCTRHFHGKGRGQNAPKGGETLHGSGSGTGRQDTAISRRSQGTPKILRKTLGTAGKWKQVMS